MELELPKTNAPELVNNHHMYWTYKKMGQFLLTRTFRDLETNQIELPVDTHTILHQRYAPPAALPSLTDMVERIEQAHANGDRLKVQENRRGPYFYHQVSHIALKQIHMEFNKLNERAI